ncbi:MAG TPA: hypothetical protein VFA26_20190, partial [Gemmataceae bacterium]|nr:hypothetical protein [Gemmataceae bacterium]
MTTRRRRRFYSLAAGLALAAFLGWAAPGRSQPKPGPAQPKPQAPTIAVPSPVGVQRGNSCEIVLTGTNLAEPT